MVLKTCVTKICPSENSRRAICMNMNGKEDALHCEQIEAKHAVVNETLCSELPCLLSTLARINLLNLDYPDAKPVS